MFAYDYSCKIVLVGECSVGKTALTQRLVYDMYSERIDSTIGVDYSTKIFKMNDSSLVKLQMWDTAGQENFISLIRTYYKDVGGAIIVYDVCDRRTFNRVHFWYNELKKNASEDYPILIVGNKIDGLRVVNSYEGQELAKELNCLYSEISVKTGQNSFEAIKKFTQHLYNKKEELEAFKNSAFEEIRLNISNRKVKPRDQVYDCCMMC
jgi:Ras-related protein Rab-2A